MLLFCLQCVWDWPVFRLGCSLLQPLQVSRCRWTWHSAPFVDEDVTGPASTSLLDIRSHVSHHAGTKAGLQNPLELVPNLPPGMDLWYLPHPHAGSEDGRTLQTGLWPTGWWAEPGAQVVVPDCTTAKASLLSDSLLPTGEAYGHMDQCGVRPTLGTAGRGTCWAGAQCFPLQERVIQQNFAANTPMKLLCPLV